MSEPLTQTDPFTQVFRKLWDQLEANESFTAIVPKGNRIKYDGGDPAPDKDQTSTADFPEVRIVASGGSTKLVMSSKGSQVVQIFQIQMASGDNRFTRVFLPLKWACIKAMANTKNNPLNFGLPFVTNVEVSAINDFDTDIEGRARGMWSGLMDIEVDMSFITATDLQTELV